MKNIFLYGALLGAAWWLYSEHQKKVAQVAKLKSGYELAPRL